MSAYEHAVDPQRMLRVAFVDGAGSELEVAAVTCAYVPAHSPAGDLRVALQIVWDPGNPNPAAPYYCPADRFERILLPPARVKRIGPYAR
ncbi:MAG: hypothetical protein HY744_00930 [Deltaproteobacteria bacterium]|nr:hypothetical protein [Deltaproteobacteria bacterium]